jgi:predicted phage terminase large subunit-like protein
MRDVPMDQKDDKFYMLDMVSGRWSFPDLLDNLKALARIYNPRCLVIEQAASGQSLIQMIKKEAKLHIHPYRPIKSKTQRLQMVLPLFEADRVRICEGVWNDDLRKQLFDFPLTLHDDKVDARVWGLQYASDMLDGTKEEMYAVTLKAQEWTGKTNRNNTLWIGKRNTRDLLGDGRVAWDITTSTAGYNQSSSRPSRTGGFEDKW